MSIAFITGITGQDGYYLSKLLLEKGMKYMEQFVGHHQLIHLELTI